MTGERAYHSHRVNKRDYPLNYCSFTIMNDISILPINCLETSQITCWLKNFNLYVAYVLQHYELNTLRDRPSRTHTTSADGENLLRKFKGTQ